MSQKMGLPSIIPNLTPARVYGRKATSPSKIRKANKEWLCVQYYLRGHTMAEVVEIIKETVGGTCSLFFVSQAIKTATQEWRKEQNEFITEHQIIALEKINNLEAEYWAGYENSKQAEITRALRMAPGKTAKSKEKVTDIMETTRTASGNVKFLDGVRWCIEKRLELLGPATLPEADQPGAPAGVTTISNTYIRRVVFTTKKAKATLDIDTHTVTETTEE